MILTEGDKSNSKFYVVLSGDVSILIRNSENVFISENLQKKFLTKLNKERHSIQEQFSAPAQETIESLKLPIKEPLKEASPELVRKRMSIKRTKTTAGIRSFPKRGKNSLIPGILTSKSIRLSSQNEMLDIEEESYTEAKVKEMPQVATLPFFHLGKDLVLQKLKEMGYTSKELYKGEGFGEVALLDSKARRTATVLSLNHVEVIVILKKDFLLIRQKFSHEYKAKKKFLVEVLPFLRMISSSSTIDNLIFCFKELRLNHKQLVISEAETSPDKVFFLMRGKCKIEKNYHYKSDGIPISRPIHICDVDYKGIIGEEILFNEAEESGDYLYTVTVVSEEAFFYTVARNSILGSFPKEIKSFLYDTFQMKNGLRKEIFEKFAHNMLETCRKLETQPMIDLKIAENQKIMKNMNLGLRLNYYQKLKNTVNEEFMNKGGFTTGNKWDSELIFESLKRSISQKMGLAKLNKVHKDKKEISNQTLIRKDELNVTGNGDIREIVSCYLGDLKNKMAEKREKDKDSALFDFGGEQQNHRFEVFVKAKIGRFQGPKYDIPHDRICKNLWEKAQEIKRKYGGNNENTPFLITSNDLLTEESKKIGENERSQSKNKKKSKAVKNLKVFLRKFDGEVGVWEDKDKRRLHSSQGMRSFNGNKEEKGKINSFSKHLIEVQRTKTCLKKRAFHNFQNSFSCKSTELFFEQEKKREDLCIKGN